MKIIKLCRIGMCRDLNHVVLKSKESIELIPCRERGDKKTKEWDGGTTGTLLIIRLSSAYRPLPIHRGLSMCQEACQGPNWVLSPVKWFLRYPHFTDKSNASKTGPRFPRWTVKGRKVAGTGMPDGFPSLLLPNLKTSMELCGGQSRGIGEVGTLTKTWS